jgi:hypothetical protein
LLKKVLTTMYNRWIYCCMALVSWYVAFSQADTPLSPVRVLLHTKQPVTITWRDNAFPFTDTPYNRFPQELLKTKDGLFLFVNGSARLYQLLANDTGIQVQRIDPTFYSGYNFGSYPFVYHDSNVYAWWLWHLAHQRAIAGVCSAGKFMGYCTTQ